jgi:Na+/H+ antiporter NhaD/arsenite permease-like protein
VTTVPALITFAVLAGTIGGCLAPELVALLSAGALIATRVLSPAEALAGFGSPALLTLMGLFVIAQGLLRSGALDRLRELLASPRLRSPRQLVALLTLVVAPLSGVIPARRSWRSCCR